MTVNVIALDGERLYALPNPYPLDGRVSTHPSHARGWASMNSYVILERGQALLIDAGLSVHESRILSQLSSILKPSTPLAIWATRIGEYNSVCNVRPIAEHFNVTKLIAAVPDAARWVDFRPRRGPARRAAATGRVGTTKRVARNPLAHLPTELVRPGAVITLGALATRRLDVLTAPLRLLPTTWIHDPRTRTLFTSDAFTHAWRDDPDGPWLITGSGDDPTDPRGMWDYLAHSRFWWLQGATTAPLQAEIERVFATREVNTVAPAFGCVLHGSEVIERHRTILAGLLAATVEERSAPPPLVAGR